MTYTPTTLVGTELANSLQWLQGDETLQWYIDAIGALFQQAAAIATDQGTDGEIVDGNFPYQTGYGSIFCVNPRFEGDTATCPTDQLPYLAQYVGVTIPPNTDDATARTLITAELGQHRGTPSAILCAARRFLTGTQSVTNLERTRPDGSRSGYWFVLVVRSDEVVSESLLIDAVSAVKPAGVMFAVIQQDAYTWVSAINTWADDTMTWAAASIQQP